jgi:hypothetical protein
MFADIEVFFYPWWERTRSLRPHRYAWARLSLPAALALASASCLKPPSLSPPSSSRILHCPLVCVDVPKENPEPTDAQRRNRPFPQAKGAVYFLLERSLWLCSLSTFLTIFCSSMRKARTILSRTQLAHREPPYARWTVFVGFDTWAYSRGRRAGICGVVSQ